MLLGFTVHGCFFCLLCAAHSCGSLIEPGVPNVLRIVWTHGERQFLAWNIYNLNRCGRWEVDSEEFSFILNGHLNWWEGEVIEPQAGILPIPSGCWASTYRSHCSLQLSISWLWKQPFKYDFSEWKKNVKTKKKKKAILHKNTSPFRYHERWLFLFQ